MTRRHTLATYADANLNDAITAASLIDPALESIDKAKAGWPTQTPGANPNTAGNPPPQGEQEHSFITERTALTPDKATTDEKALRKAIHAAQKELRIIARITQTWAIPSLDGTAVRERLSAIDAGVFCTNHAKYFMNEPRRPNGPTCDFCYDFAIRHRRAAPIEVLDYKARYGRLTEMQINRLLDKAKEREKEARRTNKKENSAA